jgi:phosphate transport system substrate-binding protein
VIDYVNANKNAIGVISVSWISDKDDPTSMAFLEKIKVVGIIDPSNTEKPDLARKPFQAYIYDGTYPLRRDVYIIRTGLRGTLGTGFASHVAGEKGQLIIHKMGMVAANAPTRVVKIVE